MIDINSIRTNSSIGGFTLNDDREERFTSTIGRPAIPVQKVDNFLEQTDLKTIRYLSDTPKYYTSIKISKFRRESLLKVGNLTAENYIIMPVPLQLVDTNQVVYSEVELGTPVGLGAQAASSSLRTIQDSGNQIGISQGSQILGQIGSGALGGAAATITNAAGAVGQGVQALLGYSPNQFLTILLKGPAYKKFDLSWQLSPRNFSESKRLKDIIRIINNAKSPSLALGGGIFTFPEVFEIGFFPKASYLYKFKPAVLEDLIINYSASGTPSFFKGSSAPDSVQITMRFLEIEFWLKGQFNDSDDVYDRSNLDINIFPVFEGGGPVSSAPTPPTNNGPPRPDPIPNVPDQDPLNGPQ